MPWSASFAHEGAGLIYRESLNGLDVGTEDFVVWTVEATGLKPDTEYTFRVGTWEGFDPQTGVFTSPDLSAPSTVTTALSKGDKKPFQLVMAGDSRGTSDDLLANAGRLAGMDARLWLFNGDMTNGGAQVEWDVWQDAMRPVLDTRVLMPVQGNHEIFANLFYAQYALPIEPGVPQDLAEHAWTLDFGNVHFVGLDSNTDAVVVDLVDWLDADLGAARNDPDIDWIFIMMHHPVYSASNHGSTARLQQYWMPLFEKHRVDLVFAGHDHDYERTHPVRAGQVVDADQGVIYVVAGGFYSPGYANGQGWWTATSAHGDLSDYVHVGVDGQTVNVTAWSGDGSEVLDQFTLAH
ncbi:MAG: metallophosphoesterase family protein [Deltaproteobacteria bacterium]|nr:metallophosphoesterase family protein [Deltaproteobacteria bacterium]